LFIYGILQSLLKDGMGHVNIDWFPINFGIKIYIIADVTRMAALIWDTAEPAKDYSAHIITDVVEVLKIGTDTIGQPNKYSNLYVVLTPANATLYTTHTHTKSRKPHIKLTSPSSRSPRRYLLVMADCKG